MPIQKTVRAAGHLIDEGILHKIFGAITSSGATYEVVKFEVGRTKDQPSTALLQVQSSDDAVFAKVMEELTKLGVEAVESTNVKLVGAPADGVAPDGFYSTTNHPTEVKHENKWHLVARQRMDALIVIDGGEPTCVKLRDVKKGQPVVTGSGGVRVAAPERESSAEDFGFMNSEVSSERHVSLVVDSLAKEIKAVHAAGKKVLFVAGPVCVHTGGVEPMERLIESGVVDGILAGNALAVHDIERSLLNTSLGIDADTGHGVAGGHCHHMRAINEVRKHGSIAATVEAGVLTKGVMYSLVKNHVPFVLAGSLRDDGPLPDAITDMNEAQNAYTEMLENAGLVIILSTMLHGIATGNMLPSTVTTVCVDINPAVVTKLCDRGSHQTVGAVTDVGLFLKLLADKVA